MPIINPRLFYAFALLALIAAPTCPVLESSAASAKSVSADNDPSTAGNRASAHAPDAAPEMKVVNDLVDA